MMCNRYNTEAVVEQKNLGSKDSTGQVKRRFIDERQSDQYQERYTLGKTTLDQFDPVRPK